jgi:hypothetical protein
MGRVAKKEKENSCLLRHLEQISLAYNAYSTHLAAPILLACLLAIAAGRNCHILSVDGNNIFFTCPEEELAWRDVATSIKPLILLKSAVCSESAKRTKTSVEGNRNANLSQRLRLVASSLSLILFSLHFLQLAYCCICSL